MTFSTAYFPKLGTAALSAILLMTAVGRIHAAPAVAEPAGLDTCVACHGAQGAGAAAIGAPRLAGQNPAYLVHALTGFKAGQRTGPTMQAVAASLSDSDIGALAAYFAVQAPPPSSDGPVPAPELVAAGKLLADSGSADIAACFSCHGAGGKGNGERYPAIAGQPANYLVARLHQLQARAKMPHADPATMALLAAKMSEAQIAAAAAYLSQAAP
jgi:cytochrome c553